MDDLIPVIRVLAALAAGLALGMERAMRGHPAGVRTHVLVAVGAAAFTLAGAYGFADMTPNPAWDPSRIAAQVASGIGFIGAGAILRDGASVKGLTTAATLWISASLGVLAGAGAYTVLLASTLAGLVTLFLLRWIRPSRWRRPRNIKIRVRCTAERSALSSVIRVLHGNGADIRSIDVKEKPQRERCDITVEVSINRSTPAASLAAHLTRAPEVTEVSFKEKNRTARSADHLLDRIRGRARSEALKG